MSEKNDSNYWPYVFLAGAALGAAAIYALRKKKPGEALEDLLGFCENASHKIEDLTQHDGFAAAS